MDHTRAPVSASTSHNSIERTSQDKHHISPCTSKKKEKSKKQTVIRGWICLSDIFVYEFRYFDLAYEMSQSTYQQIHLHSFFPLLCISL